jgi:hypothetical protein
MKMPEFIKYPKTERKKYFMQDCLRCVNASEIEIGVQCSATVAERSNCNFGRLGYFKESK